MKKTFILPFIFAAVGKSMADCWSTTFGYDCCKSCFIITEDDNGKWGYEENQWCGIDDDVCKKNKNSCWSLPDYQCCKGNEVVATDINGDWGYEDGQWCGIIKNTYEKGKSDNTNSQNESNPQTNTNNTIPQFSMESGFYENVEGLKLTLNSEGTIYYTLDSSDPTTSNTAKIYDGPIKMYDRSVDPNVYSKYEHEDNSPFSIILKSDFTANPALVDKTTIIRAATKLENGSFSPVVTKTYFVMNSDKLKYYSDIPVISLVTDPSNLFDKDKGIYVCGQQYLDWKNSTKYNPDKSEWDIDNIANFYSKGKNWERDVSFTLFIDGKEVKTQNLGMRIKGASTRNSESKGFNIYARQKYGESKLEYEMIKDNKNFVTGKPIKKYDSFSLRSNFCKSIVFLDGEFWGLYDIIERASAYYIKSNYNIPVENVAIIKSNVLEEGTEKDFQDFNDLVKYCESNDLTKEENYNYVADKMDIESIIYHYAIGLYLGIWDWPYKNYLVYRNNGKPIEGNKYVDGKWKWGSFDFDYSSGLTYESFGKVESYAHDSFSKFQKNKDEFPAQIFSNLIKNKKFYKRFAEVMHEMENDIFIPSKMKTIIEYHKTNLLKYIIKTDWRWLSYTPEQTFDEFNERRTKYYSTNFDNIIDFYENCPKYVYKFMKNTFGSIDEE
ncbi:Non-catalytic module family DOC2 [Piromyces sp. E2]|nr:Non-catalytic module family DOC2 [Piromyces sp. E2]|eukprot:OUM63365.1 Non-catalytic module family DOC2 [Piromyces sp. E2]